MLENGANSDRGDLFNPWDHPGALPPVNFLPDTPITNEGYEDDGDAGETFEASPAAADSADSDEFLPTEDPSESEAEVVVEQTSEPDAVPTAQDGGDDAPPPPDTPATPEQPDDAPPPFGVLRFSTDPEYRLDPPVPGHVFEMTAEATIIKHAVFADVAEDAEAGEYHTVDLECQTPEGSVSFEVSTLAGITAAFTDNEGVTTYHIYYADDEGMTRRYDPDIAAGVALSGQPGDVSPIEQLEGVIADTEMDIMYGSGARIVGAREMEYVNGLLERAEPIVPFGKLADAVDERLHGAPISKEEAAETYYLLGESVAATLDDPDSGYTPYEEKVRGEVYKSGGKMKITDPDGNFMQVDIGLQKRPSGEFTPYVNIKYTEPTTDTPPPRAYPQSASTVREYRLEYKGNIFTTEVRCMSDTDLTEGPGGPILTFDMPDISKAGLREVRLLCGLIRKPRRT